MLADFTFLILRASPNQTEVGGAMPNSSGVNRRCGTNEQRAERQYQFIQSSAIERGTRLGGTAVNIRMGLRQEIETPLETLEAFYFFTQG
jgi:hypothetical protein